MGVEIVETKEKEGHIDLKDLMKKLGEREIDSLLLEGEENLILRR
jgi:diaminohydroxyphosphoribosylaminopyrimidine deaminase/5-amino-6-(5-phosphoribosylamino)uracil reductase